MAFGDSITDGSCAPVDGRGTWVDWLATRFNLEKGRDVCDDIHPSPLGYYELAKAIKLNLC